MSGTKARELIRECERQAESCLYTSTSLFIWLRSRRRWKAFFTVTPLVLGTVASWQLLTSSDLESVKVFVSVCAFLAGLMPSIYSALKFDDSLEDCQRAAAEFKNLQDRFRQVAFVSSRKSFAEFENDFGALQTRLEQAREGSLTPPERFFKAAQAKVKSADYTFDVDLADDEEQRPKE